MLPTMKKLTAYNLERLKVMVVDDNRNMRMIVRQVLHALGIKDIAEAEDGVDAFKTLKVFNADIIITDWLMTPLDGIDLTRMLRTSKDSPNPYLPIIMVSGHTEAKRITEARDAGVTEFLAKPLSVEGLYKRIVNAIENPRPFVKSPNYTGPCRHRRNDNNYKGPLRRETDKEPGENEEDSDLTEGEVKTLLEY